MPTTILTFLDYYMGVAHVHITAEVSSDARVHEDVRIWQYSHIREFSQIGFQTTIGRGVYIGPGATVGSRCKIQNYAQIYEPAVIEDNVFIGPQVVLTNDRFPRASSIDGEPKGEKDWEKVGVIVRSGASIGAGAVCIAPVEIGEWACVGAGSIVSRNVPPFALVVGNPAKFIGWVGRAGYPLAMVSEKSFVCPRTAEVYDLVGEQKLVLR